MPEEEEKKGNETQGEKDSNKEAEKEDTQEKPSEDEPKENQKSAEVPGGNFFSPEIIMFVPAVLLDLIGIILLFVALDDFFITDIVGMVIIGGWIFYRSQTMPMTKKASQEIAKITKKIDKTGKWGKRLKWLRPLLISGELIPYVGALPCWTLLVFFELQS